jgi:uncharacterized protein
MNEVIQKIITQSPHLSWMKDGTIFLTVHGSRAYNTNVETSDYDYKGIAIPTKQYLYGFNSVFEQAELKDPDSVIYDIRKFFNLASAANPNIMEVLFTDEEHHLIKTPLGQKIIDNRDKFLSKRVKYSFAGYATSQFKKMKLHRRHILNPPIAPPTRKEMGLPEHTLIPKEQLDAANAAVQKELDRFNFDFMENLDEASKIMVKGAMSEMLGELKITADAQWQAHARKIGLNDNLIDVMRKERDYSSKKREWDNFLTWKATRNAKRYADEEKFGYDGKFAYHLIRLLKMAEEMLETGKVIVKRPDRDLLLHIRNGGWTFDQIEEFALEKEKKLDELYKTSTILPYKPDIKFIDNLCVSIVEEFHLK